MNGENYRILAGMLALRTFTVEQLVHFTEANPSTVRSVIGRNKDIIDEKGSLPTDRRGGREKQYQVKAEKVSELRASLKKLFGDLKESSLAEMPEVSNLQVPIGLLTAEDAIRDYRTDPSQDHDQNIEIAKIDLRGAQMEIEELAATFGDCRAISDMRIRVEFVRSTIELFDAVRDMRKMGLGHSVNPKMVYSAAEKMSEITGRVAYSGVGRLIPARSGVSGSNSLLERVTIFFDAHLEKLKDRVARACGAPGAFLCGGEQPSVMHELEKLAKTKHPTGVCILIDSRHKPQEFHHVLHHYCNTPGRLVVLDAGFDSALRNEIFGCEDLYGRAWYVGDANSLEEGAIRGTIGVASESDVWVSWVAMSGEQTEPPGDPAEQVAHEVLRR
jgi:hypothetical protein